MGLMKISNSTHESCLFASHILLPIHILSDFFINRLTNRGCDGYYRYDNLFINTLPSGLD
jgi:hypothetical protein